MAATIPDTWMRALRTCPTFHELGTSELALIGDLASERAIPGGTAIGVQGEPGDTLHLIMEGLVRIPSLVGTHRNLLLSPPEVYGVALLVAPHRHLATAVTEGHCRTLAIPVSGLRAVMDRDDGIGRRLFHEVARNLHVRFEEAIADAQGNPIGNYLG